MGLGERQWANNPIVNGRTTVVLLAAAAAYASLWTAITAAAGGADAVAGCTGVLVCANSTDVFLTTEPAGDAAIAAAGLKLIAAAGVHHFLPVNGSTGPITYLGTPACILYFD